MAKIQFSDSTNKTGLVELLGRETGTQDATTASYPLKQKTVDINDALDRFLMLARKACPNIKIDDTNFTGEPLYTQNLTSGTQQYTIATDASSAQIQAVDRVEVELANGQIRRLKQLDTDLIGEEDGKDTGLGGYKTTAGSPEKYRIVGKYLFTYPKPNYTTSSGTGLRLYHDRSAFYFASTDTAVFPGINNLFHSYLYKRPAYLWILAKKGKSKAAGIKEEVDEMEAFIGMYFGNLYNRDATNPKRKMIAATQNNK